MENNISVQYHKAKPWQLYLFSLHDLVLTVFIGMMGYITYLGAGYYGLLATTVSLIATASRIFDGITDPIIAFLVERTDGKFGRYRIGMVIGWVICAVAVLCMFFFCLGSGLVTFILIYAVYVIGYSFIMTSQGGARAIFTNEPVQRNHMGLYMAIIGAIYTMIHSNLVSKYLVPKHGGVNIGMMQELVILYLILSFVILAITVFSLRDSDVPENYRSVSNEKISVKDMFGVIKNNNNFRMILLACASDRIAFGIRGSTAVTMAIWGIIVGNFAFNGTLSIITLLPNILVLFLGTRISIKLGKKIAMQVVSSGALISCGLIVVLFLLGDPTQIGSGIFMTAIFLVLWCIYQGCFYVGNGLRMPMLADVADYEMSQNGGKQMAGIVSAAYSLFDKIVVAFNTTIVGYAFAFVGYETSQPQLGDPCTSGLVTVALILWMGMPMLGYILSLIAMKFYTLNNETMEEVQARISAMKAESK